MKQKTAKPEGGKPETAETLAGNKLAEMMGNKAREALKATTVVAPVAAKPTLGRISEYLNSVKSVPNVNGEYGGLSIKEAARQSSCSARPESVENLIKSGYLDGETFRLTEACGEHRGQLICICLSPPCRIGPFIPCK